MKKVLLTSLLLCGLLLLGCTFQASKEGIHASLETEDEETTPTDIWCGDTICNGDETPATCAIDCKGAEYTELTTTQSKELIDSTADILVLDVRSAELYNESHLENAVNIYVGDLSTGLDEILDYKNKPVVVYASTDASSQNAAQTLVDNGFSDVSVMTGGLSAWEEAEYTTVSGE